MRYYKIKKSDYEKCTSKEFGILIALGKQIPDLSFEKMMELFINKQQILKVGYSFDIRGIVNGCIFQDKITGDYLYASILY